MHTMAHEFSESAVFGVFVQVTKTINDRKTNIRPTDAAAHTFPLQIAGDKNGVQCARLGCVLCGSLPGGCVGGFGNICAAERVSNGKLEMGRRAERDRYKITLPLHIQYVAQSDEMAIYFSHYQGIQAIRRI